MIGLIFSRLYRRSSKERSFVRTGLGGQKVVMDGGAIVFPVFHETILVNMNTLKLEVTRFGKDSLFTKDRMRVDVVVAFFVRVVPTKEGIANAAQTLGSAHDRSRTAVAARGRQVRRRAARRRRRR